MAERDERLARVGEAALDEGGAGGRVAAFAETIREVEAEHAAAERAHADHEAEVVAAEADQSAVHADFEARLAAMSAAMEPLRGELADLRSAEAPASELADAEARHEAATAALVELRSARDEHRAESDAHLDALRGALSSAANHVARLTARRRATLVDLGREVIRAEPASEGARAHARDSLSEIEALRARRAAVIASRDAIDTGPIVRTVGAMAAIALLAVVLLAAL